LTDIGIVGVLATAGLTVLVAIIVIRITYYGKRTLEVHDKTGPWLTELQKDVEKGMKQSFEDVVNAASKFSSVTTIQQRCERLHKQNEVSTRMSVLAAVIILVAIIVNVTSLDILSITLVNGLAAALSVVTLTNFLQFHADLSELERKTQFKRLAS